MLHFVGDPFFFLCLAGVLLGAAGAVGSRRFARRTRPLAFRRRRRHAVPLLLIPVVLLCGLAFLLGPEELLKWWPWSLAMPAVAALLIWVAAGIPGGPAVLPLRILLILVLVSVPLSGIPFQRPREGVPLPEQQVVLRLSSGEGLPPDRLDVKIEGAGVPVPAGETPVLSVAATETLQVQMVVFRRIPPLWWLPPSGGIRGITVRSITDRGDSTGEISTVDRSIAPEVRDRLERFLKARGLVEMEILSLRVPRERGFFLQPGVYPLYPR